MTNNHFYTTLKRGRSKFECISFLFFYRRPLLFMNVFGKLFRVYTISSVPLKFEEVFPSSSQFRRKTTHN